jgi:hypothetical protein
MRQVAWIFLLIGFAAVFASEDFERPRKRTKTVVFYSFPAPCIDQFSVTPPDICRAIFDDLYRRNLPDKFRNFFEIFALCWKGHLERLKSGKGGDFELQQWGKNSVVEALDTKTHMIFISKLIASPKLVASRSTFNLETLELLQEYIDYALERSGREGIAISCDIWADLLVACIKIHNLDLFSTCIQYIPKDTTSFPTSFTNRIYRELLIFAKERSLSLSSTASINSLIWMDKLYLFSSKFGPIISSCVNCFYAESSTVQALQPALAALAQHKVADFQVEIASIGTAFDLPKVSFWLSLFLRQDRWIKFPGSAAFDLPTLQALADAVFAALIRISGFTPSRMISFFISKNFLHLSEFLLMNSPALQRELSPSAIEGLLMEELRLMDDFDFTAVVPIVVAFDFTSQSLEELLAKTSARPFVLDNLRVLIFCLKVAETAPVFLSSGSPLWRIPAALLNRAKDTQTPSILTAGKILLARHFKISPSHTSVELFREEFCFKDLIWYMKFFLESFRPELSINLNYEILNLEK